jgi:hypothetical protein
VNLNRVDARFVLAKPIRTATVLGELDGWRAGLTHTGVEVLPAGGERTVDLVVATTHRADEALRCGAMVIVEGRPTRAIRSAGLEIQRFVARPNAVAPALLLPLEQGRPAAYAIGHWSIVDRRWKIARRAVAKSLVRQKRWPAVGSIVTVAQPTSALPAIIDAARELGLPRDLGWVLTLGQGDALSRNVFHLFDRGEEEPAFVVKFARVPSYSDPFDRDERGLRLVAAAGESVSKRAPQLLGRFTWQGIHASVETAARGYRLRELLTAPLRRAEKIRLVDLLAEWIVALGTTTASPPAALEDERSRLVAEVLPQWSGAGVTAQLVGELPALSGVLQHNDLGSWNVVVRGREFTVVDWESVRRYGLPLWDLFYFLADALALLDGQSDGETRHAHTTALFRGDTSSSEILFRWTRAAATELQIPASAVGGIATLCWLHHSLSHVRRSESLDQFTPTKEQRLHGTELLGAAWLADPALGSTWREWQRRRS